MTSGLIPYDVVYCTSQDPAHPITNLVGGDPDEAAMLPETAASGWQSAAHGKVPQTLVLRFPGVVWLHQLRILSHECKIASKVEVRVFKLKQTAHGPDGERMVEEPPSFRTARFTKLGTVDFSSNEHSRYKAKERKTVHLKTEAYFVKLLFDTPHRNSLNPTDQIGLYAIECIGHVVAPVRHHMDRVVSATPNNNSMTAAVASSVASSTDGSAGRPPVASSGAQARPAGNMPAHSSQPRGSTSGFDPSTKLGELYQPPSRKESSASRGVDGDSLNATGPLGRTDRLGSSVDIQPFRSVRILEFEEFFLRRTEELLSLKEQAIAVDDFETATQCRDKLKQMNQHSQRVYQLEQDKVQAIVEEDFDKAKEVRGIMDAAVAQAFADAKLPAPRVAGNVEYDRRTSDADHAGYPSTAADDGEEPYAEDGADLTDAADDGNLHEDDYGDEEADRGSSDHDFAGDVGAGGNISPRDVAPTDGNRPNRDALPGVSPDARRVLDDRPVGGGNQRASPSSGVRNDSINDVQVSRLDPGEVVLQLHEISGEEGGPERLVAGEILAATGEEENGSVVFAAVNLDLRQLLASIGQFPTACLVARRFKLREAALTVLTEAMHDHYLSSAAAVEDAVLRFLDYNGYGLQDTIPNVVFAACTFVRMTLFDECGVLAVVSPQVVTLLPRLLTRAADPLPRIREEAVTTLTLFVKTAAAPIAPYIAAILADPLDKERRKVPASNPRAQLARLTALQVLLDSDRSGALAEGSTTTTSAINKLLLPAVNHPNYDVRDLGTTVFRKFVEVLGITLREKDIAKINNAAIKEAIVSGKRQKKV